MTSDFDPRFDPAFQRGFDRSDNTPTTGELPAPQRPAVEREVIEPVEFSSAEIRFGVVERIDTRGNPWLRCLWVIAAAFIVVGVAGQWIAQNLFSTGASSGSVISSYVIPSVLQSLSPWFLVGGLIAVIAAVTINAVRWRPPRP